jgi:hypothetical protein
MRLNNAYSKCDIPSLSAGYNRCNIGGTMIPYNIELQLEGDTDKCGNYITTHYEFPFPEDPIIKARELECNRFKRVIRKYNNRLSISVKQSLINNN